jgi:DNA-binding transcriptional LysR family regulator
MADFRMLRQLSMFLAVAEEQHFGRAARRLNISQPPLSAQIKALERSLDLRLFDRSRRGTRLSAAGAAILPAARQLARQVERFEQVVHEVAAGQSGLLRIGAINAAMMDTVPALLHELKLLYPNLAIHIHEIDSVEAVPALEAGELDLAVVRLEGEMGGGIASLPLKEDRLAVALPLDHRLAEKQRVPLRALADEPMVMSSRQVSPVYFDMLTGICRAHGFAPRIPHEVRSVTSQIAYVGCGQGVALVPLSMRRIAPGNVIVRPLAEKVMVVTAALAWSAKRSQPIVEVAIAIARQLSQVPSATDAPAKE